MKGTQVRKNETCIRITATRASNEGFELDAFIQEGMSLRDRTRVKFDTYILNKYIRRGEIDSAGLYELRVWKKNWHAMWSLFKKID